MKFYKILILLTIILFSTSGFTKPRVTIQKNPFQFPQYSPDNLPLKFIFLNANNVSTIIWNTGVFNQDPRTTNTPGLEWPKGSNKFACFTAGLSIGCYINDSIAQCMSSYKGEYVPGAIKYVGGAPVWDGDPKFKQYKVSAGDNALTNPDYANWGLMVPYGAPYDDKNNNGQYDPGIDVPGQKNSGQTIFQVLTDANIANHSATEGFGGGVTAPLLNVEVHYTAWSYTSAGLEDLQFINFVVINKGLNIWKKTYTGIVVDPDLGDPNDDYIGCDTANKLNLGFVYNGKDNDATYGNHPPSFGMDYFKSPIIKKPGLPNDTLGLTSFTFFTNPSTPGPTCENDPGSPIEAYRDLQGIKKDGTPFMYPLSNPPTRTKFCYTGDPESNTGWTELRGSIKNCGGDTSNTTLQTTNPYGDRRFIFCSGRDDFEVNPGDTQNIVLAQFVSRGSNNLNSVTKLKRVAKTAKIIYLSNFNVTPPPPPPVVNTSFTPMTNGLCNINLTWGDVSESYKYWDSVFFFPVDSNIYTFQGYEVYEINRNYTASLPDFTKPESMDLTAMTLVDQFDIVDGIGNLVDTFSTGAFINGQEQFGVFPIVPPYKMNAGPSFPDRGISRGITLNRTNFPFNYGGTSSFIYGQEYQFAVIAYGISKSNNITKGFKVIRNSVGTQILKIRPIAPPAGTIYTFKNGDTLNTNVRDLGMIPIIRNQDIMVAATYRTVLNPLVPNSDTTYNILRKLSGAAVFDTVYRNVLYTQKTSDTSDNAARTLDGVLMKLTKIRYTLAGSSYDATKKIGVIKDLDPTLTSDSLQTRFNGWEFIPPEHQFVTGSKFIYTATRKWQSESMSISYPCSGTYTNLNSKSKAIDLRKIKIVFSNTNTSMAYRYQDAGSINVLYKNMVSVPFRAYEMDFTDSTAYPVQLNVGIVDTGWSALGGWNPSSDSLGAKLRVVIFGTAYDTNIVTYKADALNNPRNFYTGSTSLDIYYIWAPRLIRDNATFSENDEFWIYPYTICVPYRQGPNYPLYYEFTTTAPVFGDPNLAKTQNALDKIRIVPNPYYGFSTLDRSSSDKFVTFRNLPLNCTIKIYTLNGDLIRTLVKTNTGSTFTSSTLEWNLQNVENTPIASGIYVALIDAPGIGTKVLKMAIFTSQERINF